jgi:hypothetical protein
MKKSKVTKITKWDKKEGYNETSFTIEFENGDKGFYNSKVDDQQRFIINSEAEYDIIEKEGKNGKKYFKVTSPLDQSAGGYKGGGKPQVDPKVQMISFSASYAKDLIVAGKADLKDFEQIFTRIHNAMTSKL